MEHDLEMWGELSSCARCRGAEGSLPTECPGVPMDRRVSQRVYAGAIDFVGGRWELRRTRGLVIRITSSGLSPPPAVLAVDPWLERWAGGR